MRISDKRFNSFLVMGVLLASLVTLISVSYIELAGVDFQSPAVAIENLDQKWLLICDTKNSNINRLIFSPKSIPNLFFREEYSLFYETDPSRPIVLRC
jgi:hypothetical protein